MSKHTAPAPLLPASQDFTLQQLQGDCARMVPHWAAPQASLASPVPPSRIHGIVVPPASARMLDAMSDYGD
ncbi:hypothetical protein H9Y04_06935 [Streptomyces sp. TRM66268-LWL]|uniref:Uncharacterized protein n=1 Tax=Streptomyces polyasparticus TaxID=2767826 RepID=A0ABR7SA53_9ACTN|nr:hypothetical protein [Streptomyces polyasparticus]MBC9712308.1 hypothetical protein [Streptomyces polyasparticus]